jgi:hypothetical protein
MPKKLSENGSGSSNDFMDVNKKKFETLFSSFIEAPRKKRDKSKAGPKRQIRDARTSAASEEP